MTIRRGRSWAVHVVPQIVVASVSALLLATGASSAGFGLGLFALAGGVFLWQRSAPQTAISSVAVTTLSALVLFSHGANNIVFPGTPIPIAEPLLVTASMAARLLLKRELNRVDAAIGAMVAVGLLRAIHDFPAFGVLALRDLIPFVLPTTVWLGEFLIHRVGPDRTKRFIGYLSVAVVAYGLTYPIRESVARFGPQVGESGQVPLLSYVSIGWMAAVAWLLWPGLGMRPRFGVPIGATVVLLFAQARSLYVLVPLLLVVTAILRRSTPVRARVHAVSERSDSDSFASPAVWVASGAILVTVAGAALATAWSDFPALSGRVGTVSAGQFVDQVRSLSRQDAGSTADRIYWWRTTLDDGLESATYFLSGQGLGVDLTSGRRGPEGEFVRKPHNEMVELFGRAGIIGLAVWLYLLWSLLSAQVAAFNRDNRRFVISLLAAQVLLFGVFMVQPAPSFAYGGAIFYSLAGLGVGLSWAQPASRPQYCARADKPDLSHRKLSRNEVGTTRSSSMQ